MLAMLAALCWPGRDGDCTRCKVELLAQCNDNDAELWSATKRFITGAMCTGGCGKG